jgi:hypothetical protein
MRMKSSNRTVTSSRMMVFDVQGRFVELPAKSTTNRLATTAQKPVTGFVENEYFSNRQLHNSVFIQGSEEIIPSRISCRFLHSTEAGKADPVLVFHKLSRQYR